MPFYVKFIFISFIASIIGLVLVKENRKRPLVLFPFLLLATLGMEYYGTQSSGKNENNILIYNLFTLFEFIFYLVFFWYIFKSMAVKKVLFIVITVYLACALLNIFFFQGVKGFHSYTYILGCMLIVIFSITYFYLLFRLPESISLLRNPNFWIVTALMFYYTCSFSLYGLTNFFIQKIGSYGKLLIFIGDLLNDLLYGLFIIGFLCRINFRKLLRLS